MTHAQDVIPDRSSPDPTVSVLMAVYNAEEFLRGAVESILQQTFTDFEFVIVNDGSTDGSPAILEDYAARDARIVLISRPNTGHVGALNDGLKHCRGEFIARMDSDDIALPQRLQRQVEWLQLNPEVVALGTSYLNIDADGDPLYVHQFESDPQRLRDEMLRRAGAEMCHPTVMMRRAAVLAVGGYRKEYDDFEDRDLWLRLLTQGSLANLEEVLLHYRCRVDSISKTHSPEKTQRRIRMFTELAVQLGVPPEQVEEFVCKELNAPPKTKVYYYRQWCRGAMRDGHEATARKYARLLVRSAPLREMPWRLVIKATIGQTLSDRFRLIKRHTQKFAGAQAR